MEIYRLRENAEKEAERLNKERTPINFCPAINGTCRKDCEFFQSYYVYKDKNDRYILKGFNCEIKGMIRYFLKIGDPR